MSAGSSRILRHLLQIVVMIVIIGVLLWYVGADSLYDVLSGIKLEYLPPAFFAYFSNNLMDVVRLRRTLGSGGFKTGFIKTMLAHFAGMLTSDVSPGRSGYFLMPVYLKEQNVPTSMGLSAILGIQTIEFLVKVFGGVLGIAFLVETVNLSNELLLVASLGVGLMFFGGVLLAAMCWSERVISLFNRIATSRFLKRFGVGLIGKVEEYKRSAYNTRKIIPEIAVITVLTWVLKGFEWFFLGSALGITQIGWIGFFLLHPLVTALSFVPLTPSGIGFQESVIVGVFVLLGVSTPQALAFALLSRVLVIVVDLLGLPQIAKSTTSLVFSRKRSPDQAIIK